uniref:Apolipoprotein C-IV n=1 Tax=Myripristis murdjan TaxID=586833 RepID=A0A667XYX5_9TELE
QTPVPAVEESDSPGILQRLAERARHAKAKAEELGGVVLGFAAAYYEDHVQPVTDPYFEWAASTRSSFWERVQKTVDNYTPFKSD